MNHRKALLLLPLICAVLAAASCTQEAPPAPQTEAPSQPQQELQNEVTGFRNALAALNVVDQRAIFDGLPPAVRLAVWRDRLAEGTQLVESKEASNLLRRIGEELSVELYTEGSEASPESVFELCQTATEILGEESANSLFLTLGVVREIDGISPPLLPVDCTCDISKNGWLHCNDCGGLSRACQATGCTPTAWGCGCAWLSGCDGECTGSDF